MGMPATDTAAITVIDGIVDTINTNVSNLAPAYGKVSVAPNLAAGKTATATSTAWTVGAATSVILTASSNTIVGVHVEQISAAGSFQLNLYTSGTICGSVVFARKEVAVMDTVFIPFRSQRVTGAITAKLASAAGGAETCVVKLLYV